MLIAPVRTQRRWLRWLPVLVLAATLLVWLGLDPMRARVDTPPAAPVTRQTSLADPHASAQVSASEAAAEIAKPGRSSVAVPAVLPSLDEPLAPDLDALLERAGQLEGPASCRLARSIQLCTHSATTAKVRESFIEGMSTGPSRTDGMVIDMLARSSDHVERWQRHCEGTSKEQIAQARRLLGDTLTRLTPAQKTALSLVRSDGQLRRLNPEHQIPLMDSNVDLFPAFLTGRVRPFLEEGYRARVPLALEGLILLHSPGTTTTRQGIWEAAPDQERFLRYSLVALHLYGPNVLGPRVRSVVDAVVASLGPAEVDRIASEAAFEAAAWRADPRFQSTAQRGFSLSNEEALACDS